LYGASGVKAVSLMLARQALHFRMPGREVMFLGSAKSRFFVPA